MVNKLDRMMTSRDVLLPKPINSHDPLVTWPLEIQDSPTGANSARKRLRHHQLLVAVLQ